MELYHFTSPERLGLAQLSGYLDVTESNIGSGRPDLPPYGEHVGPDVVWLTDDPEPVRGLGVEDSLDGTDKRSVRITVDVPDSDAEWWPDFRDEHGMNPKWRRVMEKGRDPESWWVVRRPIPVAEWTSVAMREDVARSMREAAKDFLRPDTY